MTLDNLRKKLDDQKPVIGKRHVFKFGDEVLSFRVIQVPDMRTGLKRDVLVSDSTVRRLTKVADFFKDAFRIFKERMQKTVSYLRRLFGFDKTEDKTIKSPMSRKKSSYRKDIRGFLERSAYNRPGIMTINKLKEGY